MFTPEEIDDLKRVVRECAQSDQKLLLTLRQEVAALKANVKKIQPRGVTSVSLVASDGGNNQLRFDPFHVQLIRVVDSYGKQLCLEAVSVTTDLQKLDLAQWNSDGSPKTPLGRMMADLGVASGCLNDLSHMMPKVGTPPEEIPGAWVQVYRDLCEWAVLYELICHRPFATDTLVVRDGLLRSKMFRGELFIRFREKLEQAIERIRKEDKRKIFLVGVAKRTKVLERYSLAMSLERILPDGDARYVEVPREMERSAVEWGADILGPEETPAGKEVAGKFVTGKLFFVRFGPFSGDPVWSVDLLTSQRESHQEIFGYLQKDAVEGFPVPFYPMCLQKAHNHAQIVDFDQDILSDHVVKAVRDILPEDDKPIFDALPLKQDVAGRRYE
ncbi:MAG TPA: hypothetical protein PLX89_16260 [Verrucomicrobiota bacterium]|nr:hypothetical protein [Verrucomicrobiales bacterium]HRI14551.1 hypothetical protein [Verrucomicrobiota bacterium]